MNFENRFVNALPKLIPLISLIFLLGSLWYEGLHYNFFGINIFSYISISESLNLFIDKLPLMIIISGSAILLFFGFQIIFEPWFIKLFHVAKYNQWVRRKRFRQGSLSNDGNYINSDVKFYGHYSVLDTGFLQN